MQKVVVDEQVVNTVKRTVYIAEDGKEFKSEYECANYEFKKWIDGSIEESPNIEVSDCWLAPGDGEENMECWTYYWVMPKNLEGINEINKHIKLIDDCCKVDKDYVNEWICILIDDCGCSCWISTLEKTVKHVNRLLEELGDPRKIEG